MASAARSTAILAAITLLIPTTLVLTAPTPSNDVATPSIKLPTPLDVHVVYVKDDEYKLVVRAMPDVTDVTTTASLNKVVTDVTDGLDVLQLTKEGEGDVWISPPIRVKLSNKDILHLGVHFVQEGQKESQSVNYFEMKLFDNAAKMNIIKDGEITKENAKNIKKRSALDRSDNDDHDGTMISMGTDEDGNTQQLSERWGSHGGYHGHRGGGSSGRYHGNNDFIQIPFVPVEIPSIPSPDSAFGFFGGLLGGGNRDWNQEQDDGYDRQRPHHHNHNWDMDGHSGGRHGNSGNSGMNGWGHGHSHGNNGRWPDRHRPNHNHNCNHGKDDSDEDDSNEKPSTKRPVPPTRPPWTSPSTFSPTRYTTRRTTPTRRTTTTTTTEIPDIDIRFGQGETQAGAGSDPKPEIEVEKDLPAAV